MDGTKNLFINQLEIEPIKPNYKGIEIIMLMIIILITAIFLIL